MKAKLRKISCLLGETLMCSLALPFVLVYAISSWYASNLGENLDV